MLLLTTKCSFNILSVQNLTPLKKTLIVYATICTVVQYGMHNRKKKPRAISNCSKSIACVQAPASTNASFTRHIP